MLARERQRMLLAEIARSGGILTSEFAAKLGVSEVTLRNDLDTLQRLGRVERTHGGAVMSDTVAPEKAFDDRLSINREAKHRIAAAAAKMVTNRQTILLDSGSTVYHMALGLPPVTGLTVVTPSLPIAQQLMRTDGVTVRLLGGKLYADAVQTVGTPAELGIDNLIAHQFFLATQGVDNDLDVGEQEWELVEMKRALIAKARRVILLADSSKWGKKVEVKTVNLGAIQVVITDSGAPPDFVARARDAGCEVILA